MRDLQADKQICEKATKDLVVHRHKHSILSPTFVTCTPEYEECTQGDPGESFRYGDWVATYNGPNAENDARFDVEARKGWSEAIDRAIAAEKKVKELEERIAEYERNALQLAGDACDEIAARLKEKLCQVRGI